MTASGVIEQRDFGQSRGRIHAKATTRFPLRIDGTMRPRPGAQLSGVHARRGQRVSVGGVDLIRLEANQRAIIGPSRLFVRSVSGLGLFQPRKR